MERGRGLEQCVYIYIQILNILNHTITSTLFIIYAVPTAIFPIPERNCCHTSSMASSSSKLCPASGIASSMTSERLSNLFSKINSDTMQNIMQIFKFRPEINLLFKTVIVLG